ncbi:glutathione S-transferase [Roseibium hamelinense]|uniref:Glutathione S-transferase n=1 Tax=Roseibium hamelinense TaxID=150831 RepID=A0A562T775_9HYPH|nr:glutathione S-transferase [Roseibium hamelinense]
MASGQTVELREIVLRDKAPEFLEVSPSATVPCLVLPDGTVIDESLDIMIWALETADPENWLAPSAGARHDMLALIAETDGPFKRHLDRYKYDTRYADAHKETERAKAAEFLHRLDRQLTDTGWLYGPRPSLADFAILPFVRQFANADREWFDIQPWPNLLTWLSRFEASAEFRLIMPKYSCWTAGSLPVFFGS